MNRLKRDAEYYGRIWDGLREERRRTGRPGLSLYLLLGVALLSFVAAIGDLLVG